MAEKVTIGNAELWCGDFRDIAESGGFGVVPFDAAIVSDPPYSSGGFQEAGKGGGARLAAPWSTPYKATPTARADTCG